MRLQTGQLHVSIGVVALLAAALFTRAQSRQTIVACVDGKEAMSG